jgi:hypothetical protein
VKTKESLDDETPIIILGGRGFIGRRVMKLLEGSMVYCVDTVDGKNGWPSHLRDSRVIVVNITLNSAIKDYLWVFWPGTVVINEVYPEPTPDILRSLKIRDCSCYHIVGVQASAIPSFPSAYTGAIPCCAAWPSSDMKVVVRKLN